MGYVPKDGFEDPTKLTMYDGAGDRANLGANIVFLTPASRFKDGMTQSVIFFVFLLQS